MGAPHPVRAVLRDADLPAPPAAPTVELRALPRAPARRRPGAKLFPAGAATPRAPSRVMSRPALPLCVLVAVTAAARVAEAARTWSSASPATARGGDVVQLGDTPAYTFKLEPANARGVTRLDELRGRPVLVEFWGTRCPTCVAGAVPAALRLQETFGDELQVVFVEAQGAGSDTALAFALARKWLGGQALWTSEAPFRVPGNMLPKVVLLDSDGRVVLVGQPLDQSKEIERLVGEEISAQRSPPVSAPLSVRPAWTEFARGRVARAFELLDGVLASPRTEGDPGRAREDDRVDAARAAREQMTAALTREFERIARLVRAACYDEAETRLASLAGRVRECAEFEARTAELRAVLASPALKSEREAGRALERILTRFYPSGGDPAIARELSRFADEHAGSPLAERARAAARLVPH